MIEIGKARIEPESGTHHVRLRRIAANADLMLALALLTSAAAFDGQRIIVGCHKRSAEDAETSKVSAAAERRTREGCNGRVSPSLPS